MPCSLVFPFLKKPATSVLRVEDLKVEVEGSSETSVSFYQTALRHVTEDSSLRTSRHRILYFTVLLWAWGSVVVKALRYYRRVSGSIPSGVAGDFFRSYRRNHVPWGRLSL